MAKIVIDARESGTSTGRYVDKLIENLAELKSDNQFSLLTKSHRLDYLKKVAPEFEVIESNYKEFSFSEQLGFWRQVKSLKADLVHFAMPQQPVLYRSRKVTTIHDLTTLRFDNPAKNKLLFKFKQGVYGRVIKRVAKTSVAIIAPSQFVKRDVAQYTNASPSKITITYESADAITEPAQPLPRLAGKQFIMYVGRATPHKNLGRLVAAFEQLKPKHPDLYLVLAGKTDTNYQRLSQLVSQKHLASNVVFTDFISEGQLRWLYQNCQAYIFPSLSEGFGLPGLEAMAQGAPVISSNATCLPEIYGNAAHYFNPLDPKDIAAKISDVLTDSRLRAGLISRGRGQAAKYSWRQMAQQTLDIYNKILA